MHTSFPSLRCAVNVVSPNSASHGAVVINTVCFLTSIQTYKLAEPEMSFWFSFYHWQKHLCQQGSLLRRQKHPWESKQTLPCASWSSPGKFQKVYRYYNEERYIVPRNHKRNCNSSLKGRYRARRDVRGCSIVQKQPRLWAASSLEDQRLRPECKQQNKEEIYHMRIHGVSSFLFVEARCRYSRRRASLFDFRTPGCRLQPCGRSRHLLVDPRESHTQLLQGGPPTTWAPACKHDAQYNQEVDIYHKHRKEFL